MDLLSFVPGTFLGFTLFKYLSNPKHKTARLLPNIKLWRFELSPCFKIRVMGRIVHFHHWLNLSLILTISLFINLGLFDYLFTRGVMVGGIMQGLTFPDFRRIIYKDGFK